MEKLKSNCNQTIFVGLVGFLVVLLSGFVVYETTRARVSSPPVSIPILQLGNSSVVNKQTMTAEVFRDEFCKRKPSNETCMAVALLTDRLIEQYGEDYDVRLPEFHIQHSTDTLIKQENQSSHNSAAEKLDTIQNKLTLHGDQQ